MTAPTREVLMVMADRVGWHGPTRRPWAHDRRRDERGQTTTMDRWDMMDGWGGGAGLWMLAGVLLIAVVVLIGVWLIVRSSRDARSASSNAVDILRERYARGEITKDEFETAKKTLGA
jgi:putative membrane protein